MTIDSISQENKPTVNLDIIKLHVMQELAQAEYVASVSDMSIEEYMGRETLHILIKFVGQEKLYCTGVTYPRDWWQAFKKRYFPKWLLRFTPVAYTDWRVDTQIIYPLIALPEQKVLFKFRYFKDNKEVDSLPTGGAR
jgi:hypothetical protein